MKKTRSKNTIPSAIRKAVYKRDNNACILCGRNDAVILHHVVSRGNGGQNSFWNLVCLCPICHAVTHGEFEYLQDFPFDRATAKDAIEYYIIASYDSWLVDDTYDKPQCSYRYYFDPMPF